MKLLRTHRNISKALELRLEERSATEYAVVLAGMTLHNQRYCTNGACGDGETFLYMENETYCTLTDQTLAEAEKRFHHFKLEYLDGPTA